MADDIVTRLRNSYGQGCNCFAHHSFECSCVGAQWVERYVDEAADEIERLRLFYDRQLLDLKKQEAELEYLRAQNKRLKEARFDLQEDN